MSTTVTYLFDPLCGWCYGASPAIQRLGGEGGFELRLSPTGLFAGNGAKTMDAAFADYAWSNDRRIEKLTGQRFTEAYRTQVLHHPGGQFDSTTATMALSAVSMTDPNLELKMLKVLQEARYVHALNTCDNAVVEKLLRHSGLNAAAEMLRVDDAEMLRVNTRRVEEARSLMQEFGVQGVPALVVKNERGSRLLRGDVFYGSYENLLGQITASQSCAS